MIVLLLVAPLPTFVVGASESTRQDSPLLTADLVAALASSRDDDVLPVVVQFPEGTSPAEMQRSVLQSGASVEIRHAFELIPMVSLYVRASQVSLLTGTHNVVTISLDRKVQIETGLADMDSQFVPSDTGNGYVHFTEQLGVKGLWDEGYNGSGQVIAILDSGVDSDHPDLSAKLIGFQDYINDLSDMESADGVDSYDDNGHGTACAWSAVGDGSANGGNYTGVAPGGQLLAIKVLDNEGSGDDSVIAQGVEFAWQNGADVISLSLGGDWIDDPTYDEPSVAACERAVEEGVAVVVASGNSGPAAFTVNSPGVVEEVITVGASLGDTGVVAFSSVGPVMRTSTEPLGYSPKPDVVAPGFGVMSGRSISSSTLEYPVYNQTQFGTFYTLWSGTSASTPMIGGVILLLKQKHLDLTPMEAKVAMMESATDFGLDPMVQGYGLVNATRASALLTSSGRAITLMAPMRFPTLPWSSEVLIVGDDRPPQNITIMSTHTLGTVTIEVSGNASQFITTTETTLNVAAGYGHFGIALEIPDDMPQSAVGNYQGNLTLMDGSTEIASVEIRFAVTLFGGRLMTDMEHHDSTDVDDPSYYGYFSEYLRERGVILSEFGDPDDFTTTPIDTTTIAGADVFMIMDTETYYTENEVESLHSFVAEGGTLIVLSEFYDSGTETASYAIDSYNRILEPFGIQCERRGIGVGPGNTGQVYGASEGGAVEADPLMIGVSDLYILQGSTLSVNSSVPGTRGLFWQDAAKQHAIVATAQYGEGKVFVISDGSTLYDDVLYDAIQLGADNLQLLKNLAVQIAFTAPRIYDVQMETGRYGDLANVTAYVFDDDLESVTIDIRGPANQSLGGTVTESLGYKYETSFPYESSGFYSITVVARDAAGHERVFRKAVLIPVDVIEDTFVQTVVISLLGMVAICLVYVGYQKYIVGRVHRVRRRPEPEEDEWELPPPSIE
ncbi:MAG: S8 family serine peptidase [Candidatus Thorarchaeota archaeon]